MEVFSMFEWTKILLVVFTVGHITGPLLTKHLTGGFAKLFRSMGLENRMGEIPILERKSESEMVFCLPPGLCGQDFHSNYERIKAFIGKDFEVLEEPGKVYLRFFGDLPVVLSFEPVKSDKVCIGKDLHDESVFMEFSDEFPHWLIAGTSGSGKSNTLHVILNQILYNNLGRVFIVDLKAGVEFDWYKDCVKIVDNVDNVGILLDELLEEMYRRFEVMKKDRKADFERVFLVIDEYASIALEKGLVIKLDEILRLSRVVKIHVIISTQKPDAKTLDTRLKANIQGIIGLRAMNQYESRIIIGHSGLENLGKPGRAIIRDRNEKEIQIFYFEPTE